MITILKQGKFPDEIKYIGICDYCNCEIEASKDEHDDTYPIANSPRIISVTCPTEKCNHKIKCRKHRL